MNGDEVYGFDRCDVNCVISSFILTDRGSHVTSWSYDLPDKQSIKCAPVSERQSWFLVACLVARLPMCLILSVRSEEEETWRSWIQHGNRKLDFCWVLTAQCAALRTSLCLQPGSGTLKLLLTDHYYAITLLFAGWSR